MRAIEPTLCIDLKSQGPWKSQTVGDLGCLFEESHGHFKQNKGFVGVEEVDEFVIFDSIECCFDLRRRRRQEALLVAKLLEECNSETVDEII